ncbi:hypothetical protein BCV72DRAFT_323730 [Rhizopus microsporus var. microsporus]|uniref:Uncharacterized protein n=1 Tax=Rhizopus microsporus var. microsporus TaxID=86635 RepID=A0A1X0QMI1_RHIZD|nr:hypothetical protein BCV72DRAFT_323730 [Rhizopus microsporus var. microsporus]
MNTLILTKIWYCLRLLHPTQHFFKESQKIIYALFWQRKRPYISFDQLCSPIARGSLGVMNSQVQYLVLQVRHLRHIFAPNGAPSLIQSIVQHHLSNIAGNDHFRLLSFFVPTCRKYDLIHALSIMQPIYKAFDHFGFNPDFSSLSLANLLLLSLANLFLSIPNIRHARFLASNFFYYR